MKSITLKINKRCIRCMKILREDKTCSNPKCPRYTPDKDLDKKSTDKE